MRPLAFGAARALRTPRALWEPSTTGRAGGIGDDRRSDESMVMKRHRVLIRRPALERAQPQSYISTCSVRGSGLLELKPGRGRSQKCDLQPLESETRRGRPRVAIGWRVTGVL